MANKAKKTDIGKQGLSSIKDAVVKNNLMGISTLMDKKDWKDSSGKQGKVRLLHGQSAEYRQQQLRLISCTELRPTANSQCTNGWPKIQNIHLVFCPDLQAALRSIRMSDFVLCQAHECIVQALEGFQSYEQSEAFLQHMNKHNINNQI